MCLSSNKNFKFIKYLPLREFCLAFVLIFYGCQTQDRHIAQPVSSQPQPIIYQQWPYFPSPYPQPNLTMQQLENMRIIADEIARSRVIGVEYNAGNGLFDVDLRFTGQGAKTAAIIGGSLAGGPLAGTLAGCVAGGIFAYKAQGGVFLPMYFQPYGSQQIMPLEPYTYPYFMASMFAYELWRQQNFQQQLAANGYLSPPQANQIFIRFMPY